MKYIPLLVTISLQIYTLGQLHAQCANSNRIKTIAEEKFKKYLYKIENHYNGSLESYKVLVGDMTGDRLADIIIFFSISSKEGNALVGEGVALYKNTGSDAEVIGGLDLEERIEVLNIKDQKLQIIQIRYATGETGCCPSIKEDRTIEFIGGRLILNKK